MPSDFIIRTSLPEDSGTLPKRAFDLELPVLVSAGVFWKWDGKRSEGATTGKFKNPSGVLGSILDIALDSAGFTAMSQWGGVPMGAGRVHRARGPARPDVVEQHGPVL